MEIIKLKWWLNARIKKVLYGKIGKKTYFAKPIYVKGRKHIFIGNECRIFPNARFETGLSGTITIDNDCSLGQNCHIVAYNSNLIIGCSTTISGNVFISNVNHTYIPNTSALKTDLSFKETRIGKNCFIGYGSVILPGTIIGNNCVIGANSVVSGTIPDNSMCVGSPAKIIKSYDFNNNQWRKIDE